jgi:glutathione peroxidase
LPADATATLYNFTLPLLDGRMLPLAQFSGQVVLIVNTASRCGLTPQYAGLERLYRDHKDRGFAVLGFPCNQFGGQEPGSAEQIGAFCEGNYGVSFPIFARLDVNGPNAHPLYAFLRREQPGWGKILGMNRIRWNFTKFLVDRGGRVRARFGPSIAPAKLTADIEASLNQP